MTFLFRASSYTGFCFVLPRRDVLPRFMLRVFWGLAEGEGRLMTFFFRQGGSYYVHSST